MEITSELLKTIYTRANQYCFAKYGKEADKIQIDEYGNIEAMWYSRYNGSDDDYETITPENLSADLDEVAKQRAIEEEAQRERERIRQVQQQKEREAQQLQRRRDEYLKLKKEFEP